jgi:hypothetical protein
MEKSPDGKVSVKPPASMTPFKFRGETLYYVKGSWCRFTEGELDPVVDQAAVWREWAENGG